jgi:hypothetical protein
VMLDKISSFGKRLENHRLWRGTESPDV